MIDLKGKAALVCGASKGIGRACAETLAGYGADVIVAARGEKELREVCDGLNRRRAGRHGWRAVDFEQLDAVREMAEGVVREWGAIEILINNTGGPPSGPIFDARPDAFRRAFEMHVLGNQVLAQALVPGMKERGYGRIVNIISTSVVIPIAGLGVSNTTRGAVANWGRTMAAELAPLGITVNNVLPGFTDTDRLRSLLDKKAATAGEDPAEFARKAAAATPPRRFARPEEIAAVVAFLASPAASYVNGVNLPVDGGRLAIQ